MYVSYDFYKQTFGGAIPEADFSKVKKILEAARVYLLPTGWLSRSLKGGCRHVCADCDNSL